MDDNAWWIIFAKGYLYFKKKLTSKTMQCFNSQQIFAEHLLWGYDGEQNRNFC